MGAMTAASRLREWELVRETPMGVKWIFDCSSGRAIAPAACCVSFIANHIPFAAFGKMVKSNDIRESFWPAEHKITSLTEQNSEPTWETD